MWLDCNWEVNPEKSKASWLRSSFSLLLKPQSIVYARNCCFYLRFQCSFQGALYRAHQVTCWLILLRFTGEMLKVLKGKVPLSLAPVKHIYTLPGNIATVQPPTQRRVVFAPLSSFPNTLCTLISAEQSLILGKCLCNPYRAHTGWEALWPLSGAGSTAQAGWSSGTGSA